MLVFVFGAVAFFAFVMMGVAAYVSRNTNNNTFVRRMGYSGIFLFGGVLAMALFNLGSMWYRVHLLKQLVPLPGDGNIWAYKSSGDVRFWRMSFPPGRANQYYEPDSLDDWEFVSQTKSGQIYYKKKGYLLEIELPSTKQVNYLLVQSKCVSRSHRLGEFGYAGYWVWPNSLKCNEQDKKWNLNYDEEEYQRLLQREYGKKQAKEIMQYYGTATEAFMFEICMNPELLSKSSAARMKCPSQ